MDYSLTQSANTVEELANKKHSEYVNKALLYARTYYATRLMAGISAALLPFVVSHSPAWATTLAIVVAVTTVFDQVISPKDKWVLYSRATDMLSLAKMKVKGEYEQNKELIDTILQTETANLQQLMGLQDLIDKVKQVAKA